MTYARERSGKRRSEQNKIMGEERNGRSGRKEGGARETADQLKDQDYNKGGS